MSLKIVTGGTTGAADGTLVSSSNKIVFTALDGVVDCHIRADDDTYSADASFTMPSDGAVQVSFDGGSTWKAFGTNPNSYGVDIGDLNVAIKLRQHANATASTGTFQTDATTPAATALTPNPVSGFTAVSGGATSINLSWTAVTNRSFYQIDRATNSGFTTGVALDISPGLTSTTLTDTGRTAGTTYYYRIKAIGRVRYADTASYATANATPTAMPTAADDFTDTDNTTLASHTPSGTGAHGTWSRVQGSPTELRIVSNRAGIYLPAGGAATCEYQHSDTPSSADCYAEVDCYAQTTDAGYVLVTCRNAGYPNQRYYAYLQRDGTLTLGRGGSGGAVIGTDTSLSAQAASTTRKLRIEAQGSTIRAIVDGVTKISVTDTGITAAGVTSISINCTNSNSSQTNGFAVDNFACGNL